MTECGSKWRSSFTVRVHSRTPLLQCRYLTLLNDDLCPLVIQNRPIYPVLQECLSTQLSTELLKSLYFLVKSWSVHLNLLFSKWVSLHCLGHVFEQSTHKHTLYFRQTAFLEYQVAIEISGVHLSYSVFLISFAVNKLAFF